MTELEKMMEDTDKKFGNIFNDIEGDIVPTVVCEDSKGDLGLIFLPVGREHLESSAAGVRDIFKDKDIVRYVLAIEAWTVKIPKDADPYAGPRPSRHPDRREVLMFQGEDKLTGQAMATQRQIHRDAGGKCLGDLETLYNSKDNIGEHWGKFSNMFGQHAVKH